MTNIIIRSIYFLFGITIIIYIIFLRLFLKRLPRELDYSIGLEYRLVLAIILGILISCFVIYKSYKELYVTENYSTGLGTRILLKIITFIHNALFEVYFTMVSLIPDCYRKFSLWAQQFYDYFGYKKETIIPFTLYSIRTSIFVFFLIDVFYFFKLNYFYKSLILLCIFLMIQIIIFMLKDFASNLEDTKSFVEITQTINSDGEETTSYFPSKGNEDIDLIYYVNQVILCQQLQGYFAIYDEISLYYGPRVNIIIYSGYLLGWLYVIAKNLIMFLT